MFINRPFEKTTYEEKSVEPKKLIVLAVEGAVTEHIYFNYLQKNQQDFDFKSIVRLEVLKRDPQDVGKSAPTHLVNELQTFLGDSKKIQKIKGDVFDNEYDILGIVADIEKSNDRKVNLNKAIKACNDNSIKFFLTNPCFDFWLLLHFDISEYCHEVLFENKKVSNTKGAVLDN
ncbi:RloB family protein [Francisella sp. LA112445]|uniref:RloB family protein n=1 Tax=Francisella sp. LA112445 TaxID=1395624 RepID=UPI001788A524|nr:RloB family protein [Francisella sp. LA112445]QIW10077.1 RloB domain-containing protein [Francisella sp. LA112445]